MILELLCLGLALLALHLGLRARAWARAYRQSFAALRELAEAAPMERRAKTPHEKAWETRRKRESERRKAHFRALQADIHARELGWK